MNKTMKSKTMLTTDEARKQIHLHLDFQERSGEAGMCYCTKCGGKIILISAPTFWRIDEDAYREDETEEERDNMSDSVEIAEEITAHYCIKCGMITSLSFNS